MGQSKVVLSDRSEAALQLCQLNLRRNRPLFAPNAEVHVRKLSWSIAPSADEEALGSFDVGVNLCLLCISLFYSRWQTGAAGAGRR